MKKLFLLAIVATICVGAFAEEKPAAPLTLYLSPGVYITGGSSNYFRGVAGCVDVKLDVFNTITPGLQLMMEYDGYFSTANLPIMLQLGFGPDFWIGAGTTISLTTPTIAGVAYKLGPFPNTYGLGFGIPILPLGEKLALKIAGQATYTVTIPSDPSSAGLGALVGFLAALRVYAGVQLQFAF